MKDPLLGVHDAPADAPVTATRRFFEKKRFILPISAVGVFLDWAHSAPIFKRHQPAPGSTTCACGRDAQRRDRHG